MMVHKSAAGKTQRKSPRKTAKPVTTQVDPLVMRLALDKAGGDPRRVKILDSNTVLIIN